MNNKTIRIVSMLVALAFLLLPLASCDDYDVFCEDGFEIAYSSEKKNAAVGQYIWTGDMSNTDIVIPNTYKDAPVTSLGFADMMQGGGIHFAIEWYPKGYDDVINIDTKLIYKDEINNYVKEELLKEYDSNCSVEDVVLNIKIGSNLREIESGYVRRYTFYKCMILLDKDETKAYVVSYNVQVDPDNEYFYSDDLGRMYYKDNNKLVDFFLYHNRDSFPEHSL